MCRRSDKPAGDRALPEIRQQMICPKVFLVPDVCLAKLPTTSLWSAITLLFTTCSRKINILTLTSEVLEFVGTE